MPTLRQYMSVEGRNPFDRWFFGLDSPAANRVTYALARLEQGNNSALKAVGKGVHEVRIDFGPGLRVYVGMDGPDFVILLGGSTKTRQGKAIADAQAHWADYRKRKLTDG